MRPSVLLDRLIIEYCHNDVRKLVVRNLIVGATSTEQLLGQDTTFVQDKTMDIPRY